MKNILKYWKYFGFDESLDGRRFYKYLLQSFQEPSLDISQVGSWIVSTFLRTFSRTFFTSRTFLRTFLHFKNHSWDFYLKKGLEELASRTILEGPWYQLFFKLILNLIPMKNFLEERSEEGSHGPLKTVHVNIPRDERCCSVYSPIARIFMKMFFLFLHTSN